MSPLRNQRIVTLHPLKTQSLLMKSPRMRGKEDLGVVDKLTGGAKWRRGVSASELRAFSKAFG